MNIAMEPRARRQLEIITNSRVKAFRRCKRYHYLRYWLCLRTTLDDEDLVFGTLMHLLLEAWWTALCTGNNPWECVENWVASESGGRVEPFMLSAAANLMHAYDRKWRAVSIEQYEVLGVELELYAPLVNPASGKESERWIQGMKLDVLVRRRADGVVLVIEHKTSSEDIGPGTEYWRRLRIDGQPSTYLAGARQLGYDVEGVIYDVIGKPGMRQLKATPEDQRKYTKAKPDEPSRLYASQREHDETPAEFARRVNAWIDERGLDAIFVRQKVPRTKRDMDDHAADLWAEAKIMRDCEISGRHTRTSDACKSFGKLCEYIDLCGGITDDIEQRFVQADNPHAELQHQPADEV